MGKNYTAAMKRAQSLNNWLDAEALFDEVMSQAGLTDEAQEKEQKDQGRRIAELMNQRAKMGKKI